MELIWTKSISPYLGRLGKMLNSLFYLLRVATQRVCKFSSAGCQRAMEICLRTIESSNQLGNCFIWDTSNHNGKLCQSANVENYRSLSNCLFSFFRCFVHCTCIVFPLLGVRTCVIPIILPNFHMKIPHTKEHSTCEFTVC